MERIKGFFQSLTLKQIVWSSITIGCILLYGILTIWMHHETRGLVDQQGAFRWDSEGDSAQVSCYFEEHVEITKNEFIGFEKTLEKMLKRFFRRRNMRKKMTNVLLWMHIVQWAQFP